MSQQSSLHPDLPERHRPFKRAGAKPWVVEWRSRHPRGLFRDWTRFGRYKDEATAQQVLRQKASCKYFEFRIKAPE
ncbi:MAG TPA: hypothetical protein VIG24_12930 [Acidimicrobiia bacterium]